MDYEVDEDSPAVIMDFGCTTARAGLVESDSPEIVMENVVGRPIDQFEIYKTRKDAYFGNHLKDQVAFRKDKPKNKQLRLCYPLQNGVIHDVDNLEKIIHQTYYNDLRRAPEEHALLLSCTDESKKGREKLITIMYETFDVQALYFAYRAPLALLATGRTTGTVWTGGGNTSNAVAVRDGFQLHQSRRSAWGVNGDMLTDRLETLVSKKTSASLERDVLVKIKEKICSSSECKTVELPDGKTIDLKKESQLLLSCMFDTSLLRSKKNEVWNDDVDFVLSQGREDSNCILSKLPKDLFSKLMNMRFDPLFDSPSKQVIDCIECCDEELRSALFDSVVLCGGTTLMSEFPERLEEELRKKQATAKVIASPQREHAVWKGGKLFALSPAFEKSWVLQEEYDEIGPTIESRFL